MPTAWTGRTRAGRRRVVLDQDAEEPLDRAEQRPVDHVRALPRAVGGLVLDAEPARLLQVHLQGGQLPAAADGVPDVYVDLGCVEGAVALGDHVRQARLVERVLERRLGDRPLLGLADVLVRPGGQLRLEVGEAEVAQQPDDEGQQRGELVLQLVRVQKMCESSWVKPRARVRPCTTPDFSYRYTVRARTAAAAARGRTAARRVDQDGIGQFIGLGSRLTPSVPWAGTCRPCTTQVPGGDEQVSLVTWGVSTNS